MLQALQAIGPDCTRRDKMHQRIRFLAPLICLSALLLLGFSNHVNGTTSSSPGSFAAVPESGTVTVTGRVLYPNRNGDMREVWSVRVWLYDYQKTIMSPQYVLLGTTFTDGAGVFTFPSISNYDPWDYSDPDARLDLFIVVEAFSRESGASYSSVTYFNGVSYKWNEPCLSCTWTGPQWDVPDGTVTLNYSIDLTDLNRPAMWLLRDAQRSWDYVNQNGHSDPGSTVLTWQDGQDCYPGHVCTGFFLAEPTGHFAFIPYSLRSSGDTVVHEIGHNYMYNVTQGHYWYPDSSCWGHDIWLAKEEKCAWSEGWADFFPLLVNGDYCYDKLRGPCTGSKDSQYYDLENQGWGDGQAVGRAVEGRVAGALYDLFDSNNEPPFDVATNSFEAMWIIMRDRVPAAQTLFDFGDSWKNTGYNYGQFLLVSYQNTIDYGLLRWDYLPLIMK